MKNSLRFVALLIVASLASCRQGPPVPYAERPLTLEEVKPLYQPMTDVALPAETFFPLGERYTYGGKAVNWKAPASVPLIGLDMTQAYKPVQNGLLLADGTLQTSVQPKVLTTMALSQRLAADGTYCPVKSLTLSSDPQIGTASVIGTFMVSAADASKGIQPLTRPPRIWIDLDIDLRSWEDAGKSQWAELYMINVPEAVTVTGENRCIRGAVQTQPTPNGSKWVEQRQSVANFRLEKGWNALLDKRTNRSYANSVTTTKHEWQVLPASALTKWLVR